MYVVFRSFKNNGKSCVCCNSTSCQTRRAWAAWRALALTTLRKYNPNRSSTNVKTTSYHSCNRFIGWSFETNRTHHLCVCNQNSRRYSSHMFCTCDNSMFNVFACQRRMLACISLYSLWTYSLNHIMDCHSLCTWYDRFLSWHGWQCMWYTHWDGPWLLSHTAVSLLAILTHTRFYLRRYIYLCLPVMSRSLQRTNYSSSSFWNSVICWEKQRRNRRCGFRSAASRLTENWNE